MKIAYVYDAVYPYVRGGVEKRIREISARLAARGHDVHVFGMRWWDGPALIEEEGVTLHGVCPARPLYAGGRRTAAQAAQFAQRVLWPLLASGADLIDCQNFPYLPCFTARAAALARRIPLAITWHEVWGDYWHDYLGRRGILGAAVERWAAGLSHHPIAVSPSTARALEALGVAGPVPVIPNGIDLRQIAGVAPASDPADVIFAGRLIREKNVDLLLRALALVREEIPDLRTAIVGDGPERQALERLARDLGLDAAVAFTGFLPGDNAVIAAMKAARVFVLPSTREGFGMAALEAMACGLPVVTVDHPRNAARDLVVPGANGHLSPLTADGLAQGIAAALAGRAGMQDDLSRTAAEYEWDAIAARLEGVYQGMTGR